MLIDPSLRGTAAIGLHRALASPVATTPSVEAPTPVAAALPNPRLRLDSDLGIVVLEFRDPSGEIHNSLPTEREMAAYRAAAIADQPLPSELGLPGPAPLPKARETRDVDQPKAGAAAPAPQATGAERAAVTWVMSI